MNLKKTILSFWLLILPFFSVGQDQLGRHVEHDGFVWLCEMIDSCLQVSDKDGNIIIKADRGYTKITYNPIPLKSSPYYDKALAKQWEPWFTVGIKENDTLFVGACDLGGREIVPPAYKTCSGCHSDGLRYVQVTTFEDRKGIYLWDSRMLIPPMYKMAMAIDGSFLGDMLLSFPLSNKIKDSVKQQALLDAAVQKGENTDGMLALADNVAVTDANKALKQYSKIIKKKPSTLVYLKRAKCHLNMENYKAAIEDLQFAMFLDDGNPELYDEAFNLLQTAEDILYTYTDEHYDRTQLKYIIMKNAIQAAGFLFGGNMSFKGGYFVALKNAGVNYSSMRYYGPSSSGSAKTPYIKTAHQHPCTSCDGEGKCKQGKYACHGSKECKVCNGTGNCTYDSHTNTCSACNGSGTCAQCKGTGQCQRCHGSGML